MITNELLEYIKKEQTNGKKVDEIKNTLLANGWAQTDITEAYISLGIPHNDLPPILPNIPNNLQNPIQAINPSYGNGPFIIPKRKKHLGLISLLIFILIIIAGGAYAYTAGYFTPLDRVSMQAYNSIKETKSGTFDTTISVDLSEIMQNDPNVASMLPGSVIPKKGSISISGSYDINDANNPKGSGSINLDAGSFTINSEIIFLDKILYAKLTKVPSLGLLLDTSNYANKWISFPMNNDSNPIQSLPFMSFVGIDQNALDKLTQEQKNHVYELTNNAHFITIKDKLSPESINGVNSFHFTFELNKAGINSYINSITDYIHEIGKNDSYLSSFDSKSFIDAINNNSTFMGEAWIGRSDHMPYKIVIDISQKMPGGKGSIYIKVVSIFKDWDKIPMITAPIGSQTLEQLIESLSSDYSGSLGQARLKATIASIKSNLVSIMPSAELYYDNHLYSYVGVCNDKDFADSKNDLKLENPTDYKCLDSKTGYAVSVRLPTGDYYCVDSTGYAENTLSQITKSFCL